MRTANKFAAFATLVFSYISANAADVVGTGKIDYVENGWEGEGLAIHHSVGIDGCTASNTEYAIEKNHLSYKELVSMALSAFALGSDVQLVVERGVCSFGGRTKVLSIRLIK